MPTIFACPSCQTKLRIPDAMTGKAVKCPKCRTAIPARAAPKPPAPAAPRKPPPPAESVSVGEDDVVEPPDEVAVDENDVVAPAGELARPAKGQKVAPAARTGGSSKLPLLSFEELDVPDAMREAVEAELTSKEKIIWLGRPWMTMYVGQAKVAAVVGVVLLLAAAGGLGAYFADVIPPAVPWYAVLAPAGILVLISLLCILAPILVKRSEHTRPCYVITNRRAMLCEMYGRSRVSITRYNGPQLEEMERKDSWRYPGAGDLVFEIELSRSGRVPPGRLISRGDEQTRPIGFLMLQDVAAVEKLLRQTLIDTGL